MKAIEQLERLFPFKTDPDVVGDITDHWQALAELRFRLKTLEGGLGETLTSNLTVLATLPFIDQLAVWGATGINPVGQLVDMESEVIYPSPAHGQISRNRLYRLPHVHTSASNDIVYQVLTTQREGKSERFDCARLIALTMSQWEAITI